jgi:UDP-2,3-diacylglucosamine pyrophosphatase LpxH
VGSFDRLPKESLLVLSDVHLGNDLNDHPQPVGFGRRSKQVDDDLVRLIEHYRAQRPRSDARWRIVFAGDFVDFIGMAILDHKEALTTEPSDEEKEHGLGNAEDHARIKLRKVEARHREVFAALGRFVADGHAITVVHGNHDLEFYWDAVRDEFRELLARHAGVNEREAYFARIDFTPWFFYQEGLAYIEHGHQYDPLCATDHVMAPLSPLDPRRIARGFSDVFLRYVVRPTRGLREYGHERMGIFDYIRFGVGLGTRGVVRLFLSFLRATVELFRLRRAAISDAAKRLREEHDRRVAAFAEAMRVDVARLRALTALQVPPIQWSVRGILSSLLLDRLALGIACAIALSVFLVVGIHHHTALFVGASIVLAAWIGGHVYLSRTRVALDPDVMLRERAASLARLFPAAFVVMGHTHTPVRLPVADGTATYINVGSWSEEEAEGDAAHVVRAARTHLVIHAGESGPVAEFLTWDSNDGPRAYDAAIPAPGTRTRAS